MNTDCSGPVLLGDSGHALRYVFAADLRDYRNAAMPQCRNA